MNRRKFVKNIATGLFLPTLLLPRKSQAATQMLVNPYLATFPVTSGLLLRNEGYDFDALSNGASITQWNDLSGNGHHWLDTNNAGTANFTKANGGTITTSKTTISQTLKANGHATVRFIGPVNGACALQQTKFFGASGFTGLEAMIVYRIDADPPVGNNDPASPFQFNHPLAQFPNHVPFTDGHIYEGFGRTDRPDMGDPTASFQTAFRLYNVASKADGSQYDIWVDTQNLVHVTSGYTYQQQGQEASNDSLYFLGLGEWYTVGVYCLPGNIAACYVWNRVLTAGERTSMRTYINSVYGTSA